MDFLRGRDEKAPMKAICPRENLLAACQLATVAVAVREVKPPLTDLIAWYWKGRPAPVDGPPTWLADNTDVVALTPSADGMSCDVVAVGIPGTAKVQVSADADLGSGTELLVGTLDVEVTAAPAKTITLTPGTVVDQP
jgi:hypothetical protein